MVEQFGSRLVITDCPEKRTSFYNVLTKEDVLRPNGNRTCVYCNRREATRFQRAVSLARPDRMLLATGLTGTWDTDRTIMQRFQHNLRRAGVRIELCWTVEPNPRDDRAHVQGWVHGDPVSPKVLQDCATRAGMGITTLRPADRRSGYGYIIKNATHNETSLAAHRQANGSHLFHSTRSFWRDPFAEDVVGYEAAAAKYRHARRPTAAAGPKPIRHLHALSPAAAARTRDRNGSVRALISKTTGEVIVTRHHVSPGRQGSALIGPLIVCFQAPHAGLSLVRRYSTEPVVEQTLTIATSQPRRTT